MTGPRDLRGILESYRQSGKLTTLTGRLDPYLEAAARVREAEPSPVLLERLGVAANLLSTRDELAARASASSGDRRGSSRSPGRGRSRPRPSRTAPRPPGSR